MVDAPRRRSAQPRPRARRRGRGVRRARARRRASTRSPAAPGVGHGTVFRRFPTKDSLVAAVVCKRLGELSAAAEELLDRPDAGAAFEEFVWQIAEVLRPRPRASSRALPRCSEIPEVAAAKERLDASSSGSSRAPRRRARSGATSTPQDVPVLVGSAILGCDAVAASGEAWRRYVAVVLDGLRTR